MRGKVRKHFRFISFVLLAFLCTNAFANKNKHKVFILETMDIPIVTESCKVFIDELTRFLPHSQIEFVFKNAEGDSKVAAQYLSEQITAENKPDLLVSVATLATRALIAQSDEHGLPMVFMVVSDPVAENIVPKLGQRSELNITGKSHVVPDYAKLEMLTQILDSSRHNHVHRVALIASDYPSADNAFKSLTNQAKLFPSIEFVPVRFNYLPGNANQPLMRKNILKALRNIESEVEGYWIPPGPAAHDKILQKEIKSQLGLSQLFAEELQSVKNGALLGVFADSFTIGRSAAIQAQQILMGAKANELPVERPQDFVVAVNIASALQLGYTVPSKILTMANEHIYK